MILFRSVPKGELLYVRQVLVQPLTERASEILPTRL
jgi:hypothetical protein